jgi:hypothetical protein
MTEKRDRDPCHHAIHAKLAQIAAAASTPPTWYEAWLCLGPDSPMEENLSVYRAVRGAGSLPQEAGFYLVSWQIDAITNDVAAESLKELEDRVERIIGKYGLNEEDLCLTEGTPAEYDQALRQLHDAWGALFTSKMEEFGESEMARMFRTDRKQFAQTSEAGRQFFFGPEYGDDEEDLEWLDNLQDAVAACVEAESPMGPLGLSYGEEEGFWEITIYPTPVELVGGADDGAVVTPGFSLDLEQLRSAFDSITAIGWNALGLNYSEGPHVYVEGVYEGRDIFLQVLAYAPEDEDPGLKVNVS